MRIDAVSIGKNPPHEINVIIEVPIGGEPIKYEMDKASGALVVDRFLYTSMRYPGNYGFIPHTLSDDGDPCDVIVANTSGDRPRRGDERASGRRAVDGGRGRRRREDPGGALRQADPPLRKRAQLYRPAGRSRSTRCKHFFEHYKDLETNKWVKVVALGRRRRGPQADHGGHRALRGQEGLSVPAGIGDRSGIALLASHPSVHCARCDAVSSPHQLKRTTCC